ncbi:MAG: UDP-N-acetylmuramoyl-L-alanyl-D-glutamate--2,6-diaminopimelate ligase [Firmicutes bacterium]|nr:UDP-N-acetylmuramoyl-L-alanyl-D-glutamate--2,6-diaminopimelate ligase [Bacillota bacterium]
MNEVNDRVSQDGMQCIVAAGKKTLRELLLGLDVTVRSVDLGTGVSHLVHHSAECTAGSLFFAVPGTTVNGAMYIANALANGAVAVVCEDEMDFKIPHIVVPNVRTAMSEIAKTFYDNACDKMDIVGITGTNGKTTTANMIYHVMRARGIGVGVIGTLGAKAWDGNTETVMECKLTTPDPIELHKTFHRMVAMGVRTAVMECSAHAIHLRKLVGINFRVGIFTNLSMDHLDFFGTYRKYADTKVNWFADPQIKTSIINIDDIEGTKIKSKRIVKYSLGDVTELKLLPQRSRFRLGGVKFEIPASGRFNVYNALAVIACCRELGIALRDIARGFAVLPTVPGRFNVINVGDACAVVDFAHTPDALSKIIESCRELLNDGGRLITVFGCGGNRDMGKRPIMGTVSARHSDFTVITSDNPRMESPRSIALQILAGVKIHTDKYHMEIDRTAAINYALDMARAGDIVLIAGKGAEDYLDIGGRKTPYSDYAVIDAWKATKIGKIS